MDLEENLDQIINIIKAWFDLRKNTRWLIIYNNYDNSKNLNNSDPSAVNIRLFVAGADHGSIIITTRLANITQNRRLYI